MSRVLPAGPVSVANLNTELKRTPNTANTLVAGGITPVPTSLFGLANGLSNAVVDTVAPHKFSEFFGYSYTKLDFILDPKPFYHNQVGTIEIKGDRSYKLTFSLAHLERPEQTIYDVCQIEYANYYSDKLYESSYFDYYIPLIQLRYFGTKDTVINIQGTYSIYELKEASVILKPGIKYKYVKWYNSDARTTITVI